MITVISLAWQIIANSQKSSRKGDWEVMDRAFHGVRIGAPITTLQKIGLKPIDRSGSGAIKITKYLLENGNAMSVTYDSVQDRILYMEIDWNQQTSGMDLGLGALRFGSSTLQQIRRLYKSNGFSYARHMMVPIADEIVAFNAFELNRTPTIIVVFITKLSRDLRQHIAGLPEDQQAIAKIGEHFTLDAVVVAGERYLDEIWGKDKVYDPKSMGIQL